MSTRLQEVVYPRAGWQVVMTLCRDAEHAGTWEAEVSRFEGNWDDIALVYNAEYHNALSDAIELIDAVEGNN